MELDHQFFVLERNTFNFISLFYKDIDNCLEKFSWAVNDVSLGRFVDVFIGNNLW